MSDEIITPTAFHPNRSIREIKGLRGVLALWVFVCHTFYWCNLHVPVLHQAGLAVEAFMLISGFVITRMVVHSKQSYGVYIVRRLARLYPALLLSLIIGLVVSKLTADAYVNLPWKVEDNIRFEGRHALEQAHLLPLLLGHLTMLNGLFPEEVLPGSSMTFVPAAWSLSLEWQFYLVAPLMIAALRIERLRLATIAVFILAIAAGHALNGHLTYLVPAFLPLSLVFFIAGIMCGHLYDRLASVPGALMFYGAALISIVLFASIRSASLSYIIWLWCMCASLKPDNRWLLGISGFLNNRGLCYFGDRSYSFYLFHQAILGCCVATLLHFGITNKIEMLVLLLTTAFLLTFLLSVVSYRFVELPVIEWAKATSSRRNRNKLDVAENLGSQLTAAKESNKG